MAKNEKADLRGIGLRNQFNRRLNTAFSYANYTKFRHSIQCKHCDSDYMRFSVNGYCQRYLQRAEYVIRELPSTTERASAMLPIDAEANRQKADEPLNLKLVRRTQREGVA